jgi:hypothetical protein
MFGRGLTRLQPVYVGDVAQAIAGVLERTDRRAVTFELGRASYLFIRGVAQGGRARGQRRSQAGIEARLVPMPFAV